jgi:hypothetical protein
MKGYGIKLNGVNHMGRLLAFGCSYTFGVDLGDWPSEYPSEYAWPNILANLLDKECLNRGSPGASNKTIWCLAAREQYRQDDIVIFLWTHIERYSVVQLDNRIVDIGPWTTNKMGTAYYRYFQNTRDSNVELNCKLSQIKFYLDKLKIQNYHCFAAEDEVELADFNRDVKKLKTSFDEIRSRHGVTSDGFHPDKDAHREFAISLYKELKKNNKHCIL